MGTEVYGMAVQSIAAYAPPESVTNQKVAERLHDEMLRYAEHLGRFLTPKEAEAFQTNDRWIRRFIGFSERRFAPEGQGTIDLAVRAAQLLTKSKMVDPRAIDAIIFATVTPSYLNSPPDSALLQDALNIPESVIGRPRQLFGVDVSLACSSWVAGLRLAYALIRSRQAKCILLIGADVMSRTINWRDRAFATVLGDAGTAMVLAAVSPEEDWFSPGGFWGWLGGSQSKTIITPMGGSSAPLGTADDLFNHRNCLTMDGRLVKELIVPFVGGPGIDAALQSVGRTLAELDAVVLHEANLVLNRQIVSVWRERGFVGAVLDADGKFGNTTSASIPLALALNVNALPIGTRFGLIGFGGGFSAAFAFGTVKHQLNVVMAV